MTEFIIPSELYGFQRWHLNRPERLNALGTSIAKNFQVLIKNAEKRLKSPTKAKKQGAQPLRGIVLTAETVTRSSGSYWIAGGDLKELASLKTAAAVKSYTQSFHAICRFFETCPVPIIACIDGLAIGGGAELALAADIRIGSANSGYLFKQLDVGLATGYGGGKRLVDLVGKGMAQQLLYSGRTVSGDEAYRMGLLTHHCATLDDAELKNILDTVCTWNTPSFAAQKRMLRAATSGDKADFARKEQAAFLPLWGNPQHLRTLENFR